MIAEDLDAMYEETYKKNEEIQTLLIEVKDYNEILNYLYETDIQRPNRTLNLMIDTYESDILKLRELDKNITKNLEEFGQEQELAREISEELSSGKWMSTQTTAYALVALARDVASEYECQLEVAIYEGAEGMEKFEAYKLLCVPAVVVNGSIRIEGICPSEATLNNALREGGLCLR